MARRSYKRPVHSVKDNAGCMWGLINMFDFRQGHSSQKLLSDSKHRSGRHVGLHSATDWALNWRHHLPERIERKHKTTMAQPWCGCESDKD